MTRHVDEKGLDDKIVAVSVHDPSFADYTDKDQLPAHELRQLRRFFEHYKALEHKQVVIEDLMGPADAVRIVMEGLEMYRRLRRGELCGRARLKNLSSSDDQPSAVKSTSSTH